MSPDLAGPLATNDYDSFATAYAADTESNLINGHYARPAVLDLLGDIAGRRILDMGCGAGPLTAAMVERDAIVTAADPSANIVDLARARLGGRATVIRAGLGETRLPFADGVFDDVVACLVLHYLRDWTTPLAELRRVLVPGGRLIVVVNHPMAYKFIRPDGDYFAVESWSDEYQFGQQRAVLSYWHRPLHAMFDAFTAAGFRVAVLSEPPPDAEAGQLFPDLVTSASGRFLCYLFLVLEAR